VYEHTVDVIHAGGKGANLYLTLIFMLPLMVMLYLLQKKV